MSRLSWSMLWSLNLSGRHAGSIQRRRARLCRLEWLEHRVLLCGDGSPGEALPIGPSDVVVRELDADHEVGLFQVTLPEAGRLTVQTRSENGSELETRTSLLESQGRLLIQSDG